MSLTKIRIAAKTDVGLARTNNEDNFQAAADLSVTPMRWTNNRTVNLGPLGALLVVADGMGGMNAGEVASAIAIETVCEYFKPEYLAPVISSRSRIDKHLRTVVAKADQRIKEEARRNPASRGMGTTLVIAWLLAGKLYLCWVGNSRAYLWNRATGLRQLSHDHSRVQELVDTGRLTEDEAIDYPDSNIITRSLSDGYSPSQPDTLVKPIILSKGDVILLCSDGLNGMLRDRQIEAIISANTTDLTSCVDALISGALQAGGSDDVTVVMAQVLSDANEISVPNIKNTIIGCLLCVVLIGAGVGVWKLLNNKSDASDSQNPEITGHSDPGWQPLDLDLFNKDESRAFRHDHITANNSVDATPQEQNPPQASDNKKRAMLSPISEGNKKDDILNNLAGTEPSKPARGTGAAAGPQDQSSPGNTSSTSGAQTNPGQGATLSAREYLDTSRPRIWGVKEGDTLNEIIRQVYGQYNFDNNEVIQVIKKMNGPDFNPSRLTPGKKIKLPSVKGRH